MSLGRSPLARIALVGVALFGSRAVLADAAPGRPPSADEVARLRKNADKDEQGLARRLDQLRDDAKLTDQRILWRGRLYVRLSRAGLLPVGDGFEALVDHAARLERLHHGLELDVAHAKAVAAERVTLAKKLDEARARTATLDEEERVLARAEDALRSADERERAFAQAFEAGGHTAVYGAVGPAEPASATAGGFAALKGRLPFPIAGRSEIRPARRQGSEGPGLEMKAAPGTPVRAVAAGRVAFADSYADYGKTIIVEHGRRYYTVCANLGSIDVAVGDEVSPGERLGSVSGGDGAKLYFEVRVGKETVDPSPWFGI
ncbi:MAG TPA: peptidoglycan DD-metalloendopeptidase family protein [Polyangiaceae bacterium]|nr:peptidoglycan DD-metalloendopeptidase family protein [Polyangiaceae bacterium]